MKLIGPGLCLIGIGIIAYDIIIASRKSKIPKWMPKGKPAGTYEIEPEWEFPED